MLIRISFPLLRRSMLAGLACSVLLPPLWAAEEVDSNGRSTTEEAAAALPADPITASSAELAQWIEDLSHDAYAVRQAAASRLLAVGTPARDALQELASGPDPEARAAARRLIILIDRSDFARRLEAFAADTDGRRRVTLPGWENFRVLVGGDPAARSLFVDIQRAEGATVAAAFGGAPRTAEKLWEERLMRLVSWQLTAGNRNVPPPMGSCAAMIFLGSVPEIDVSDKGAMWVDNLIQRSPVREAIVSQTAQDAMRRLVVAWIEHCPNKNEEILKRRMNLISGLALREAIRLPLEVATKAGPFKNVEPATQEAALLVIGQYGSRSHVEQLEPLLEDDSICKQIQGHLPGRQVSNVQIRDVALCVMLHLTGQRPAEYGYTYARLQPQQMFVPESLYCENDEKRSEAIDKWRAWRKTPAGQDVAQPQAQKGP